MKKFFALFLVVALLALAGSAFAAPGDKVGHDGNGNNSGGGTSDGGTVVVPSAPVIVIVTTEKPSGKMETVTKTIIGATAQKSASIMTFDMVKKTVAEIITQVVNSVVGYSDALIAVWTAKTEEVQKAASDAIATPAAKRALFSGVEDIASFEEGKNEDLESAISYTDNATTSADKLAAAGKDLASNETAVGSVPAVKPQKKGIYKFPQVFGSDLYGVPVKGHRGQKGGNSSSSGGSSIRAAEADNSGVVFLNSSGDVVTTIPGDENSQDIMPGYVNMLVAMDAGKIYEPVIYTTTDDLQKKGIDSTSATVQVAEVTYGEEARYTDETGKITDETVGASEAELKKIGETIGNSKTYKNVSVEYIVTDPDYSAVDTFLKAQLTTAATIIQVGGYITPVKPLPAGDYVLDIKKIPTALTSGYEISPDTTPFKFFKDGVTSATATPTADSGFFILNDEGDTLYKTPKELSAAKITSGKFAFTMGANGIVTAAAANDFNAPLIAFDMAKQTAATPGLSFSIADVNVKPGETTTRTLSASGGTGNYTYAMVEGGPEWVTLNGATVTIIAPNVANKYTADFTVNDGETTAKATMTINVSDGGPGTGPGDSSGGCSTGFTALALAVLGSFIATRKK